MTVHRDNWGSRLGFVLAAAGSAVGLGNLWKFPYITWDNGGGGFVLIYLLAVFFIGLPLMMSEILIGRTTQLSPVPAFVKLGGKRWGAIGWLGVASGAAIQSYYMVIAGWSLKSFVQCVGWSIGGYEPFTPNDFGAFLADGWLQILLTGLFTLATAIVVYRGIGGGIERATKFLMPALLLILIYLVGTTMTMPGRAKALGLIFSPDFSHVTAEGFLEATGQAFFSLSLGLGAMVAYGSYLSKKESIFKSALWVVVLDTVVALLACIAMFTIIFSVDGLEKKISGSTVGMLFITLPDLFYTKMPGGSLLGPLFFILVGFAALSSTISLGEVTTSLLIDLRKWRRPVATIVTTVVVFLGSILAALSLGASDFLSGFEVFKGKAGVLSTLDHLVSNWMLPTGALLTVLFVGWRLRPNANADEFGIKSKRLPFILWLWLVRVVAPVAIIILLINVILGKDFS
jgi:neurotransmitter:Na+ symporter, NSS family